MGFWGARTGQQAEPHSLVNVCTGEAQAGWVRGYQFGSCFCTQYQGFLSLLQH